MAKYVPELLNELTRIVLTTPNTNPSVEEYQREVLPRWKRCQELQQALKDKSRPASVEEVREVAQKVLAMLRTKQVSEAEIRDRVAEAFRRCREAGDSRAEVSGLENELFGA